MLLTGSCSVCLTSSLNFTFRFNRIYTTYGGPLGFIRNQQSTGRGRPGFAYGFATFSNRLIKPTHMHYSYIYSTAVRSMALEEAIRVLLVQFVPLTTVCPIELRFTNPIATAATDCEPGNAAWSTGLGFWHTCHWGTEPRPRFHTPIARHAAHAANFASRPGPAPRPCRSILTLALLRLLGFLESDRLSP